MSLVRPRFVVLLVLALLALFLSGCTSTPGMFPREHGSRVAEKVWLTLVHSSVSRWFDEGYARAELRQDDSAGPWAVGRIARHTVSILGTGAAVANNFSRGIGPTGATCR